MTGALSYYINNNEIVFSYAKTFVIPHPVEESKYLVHGCLEGPEAGVYYRGKGEIVNGQSVTIELPAYVAALATDFSIQITGIYDGKMKLYNATEVVDGHFEVFGDDGKFWWMVHGMRNSIVVEPNKEDVELKGSGPYLWI
jgi:hypothetical protein